jgi:hypothetical protein
MKDIFERKPTDAESLTSSAEFSSCYDPKTFIWMARGYFPRIVRARADFGDSYSATIDENKATSITDIHKNQQSCWHQLHISHTITEVTDTSVVFDVSRRTEYPYDEELARYEYLELLRSNPYNPQEAEAFIQSYVEEKRKRHFPLFNEFPYRITFSAESDGSGSRIVASAETTDPTQLKTYSHQVSPVSGEIPIEHEVRSWSESFQKDLDLDIESVDVYRQELSQFIASYNQPGITPVNEQTVNDAKFFQRILEIYPTIDVLLGYCLKNRGDTQFVLMQDIIKPFLSFVPGEDYELRSALTEEVKNHAPYVSILKDNKALMFGLNPNNPAIVVGRTNCYYYSTYEGNDLQEQRDTNFIEIISLYKKFFEDKV